MINRKHNYYHKSILHCAVLLSFLLLCFIFIFFSPSNLNIKSEKLEWRLSDQNFSDFPTEPINFYRESILDTCADVELQSRVEQRGDFYVLYNYVLAERRFGCGDSITLTSPGDFRFLDNVISLVKRWKGPISIALYAPGDDFFVTTEAIAYLRTCQTALIRELVTFHIFFDMLHVPNMVNYTNDNETVLDYYQDTYDCNKLPPWETFDETRMYKNNHTLLYPINTARNIARISAQTYFVFPSDIELYPTPNFIEKFLTLVRRKPEYFDEYQKNVFALPVFEILDNQEVPTNKTELQTMLANQTAILFHRTVCWQCHEVPNLKSWIKKPENGTLDVFTSGKRYGRHVIWEPFYIGTQKEPLWDERLTWEGQSNKMIQAYTLCLMDYNFLVLNEAFLVHKPGVKKKKIQNIKFKKLQTSTNALVIDMAIELQNIYGFNEKCKVNSYYN